MKLSHNILILSGLLLAGAGAQAATSNGFTDGYSLDNWTFTTERDWGQYLPGCGDPNPPFDYSTPPADVEALGFEPALAFGSVDMSRRARYGGAYWRRPGT